MMMRRILFLLVGCILSAVVSGGEARSPQIVIDQLLNHYGKNFGGSYVEALSLVARAKERGEESVEPYVRKQLANPAKLKSGTEIAGRLIFAEMAATNPRARQLTLEAANLAFEADGTPRQSMPFHNEMSDSVFMACSILAKAGSLTGDRKYFDQCVRHFRLIRGLCLRKDGIYRHSPLDESAWGRGNGFPAIGLAMTLEELPRDHPDHEFVADCLRSHLAALRPFQDEGGMWHQVIDHSESYPEFTCTCMISYAALAGIRLGILEKTEWDDSLRNAWKAIDSRIDRAGREVRGACAGTGKQKSLDAYLRRPEINGYDDRAGSMALLFAREMKGYLSGS